MFSTNGYFKYFEDPYKLIVDLDPEISNYYLSLIPRYLNVRQQKYNTHISVVRKEIPISIKFWQKYQNELVEIKYDHFIFNNDTYFWLNAFSPKLEYIREELGLLPTNKYTRSPDGAHKFHITIGNIKGI